MLFDEKTRTYEGPMEEGENFFDYYDRSSRPEVDEKRTRLNNWIAEIEGKEALELVSRMKQNTEEFVSAELELILHRIFRKLGYGVTLHPKMKNGRAPDFLVRVDNIEFLCEATIIRKSAAETANERRTARLISAINRIRLPAGYFFALDLEQEGKNSPNLASICRKIGLVANQHFNLDAGTSFQFNVQSDDWDIGLELVNGGGKKVYDRSIGIRSGGAEFINASGDMRARLNSKSRRYGTVQNPFVLAVADTKHYDSHDHVIDCLFGDEAASFDLETNTATPFRRGNGFFGTLKSPRNSHVSGVIIFPNALYWAAHIGERHPTFFPNPWANIPIDEKILPLNIFKVSKDGELLKEDGVSFANLIF